MKLHILHITAVMCCVVPACSWFWWSDPEPAPAPAPAPAPVSTAAQTTATTTIPPDITSTYLHESCLAFIHDHKVHRKKIMYQLTLRKHQLGFSVN